MSQRGGAGGPTGVPSAPSAGQVLTTTNSTTAVWATGVSTVAGRTGTIVLAEGDITNLTADLAAKVDKSTATTKGDLLVATASATLARLGKGSDGYVLTADSTQSTGLKWAVSSGGGKSVSSATSAALRRHCHSSRAPSF